jgi:hypothetical protein
MRNGVQRAEFITTIERDGDVLQVRAYSVAGERRLVACIVCTADREGVAAASHALERMTDRVVSVRASGRQSPKKSTR